MHTIKARSTKITENDNLYALFQQYTKYDITFIRNWLKTFMLTNRRNFELRTKKYLASKVLTYENWMDSISDGRKGDIFALYGLCLLFSKHAIVHLHNGLVWSTLQTISNDHQMDIDKCNLHLCYLGRGIFMELVKHDTPLQIADSGRTNVRSIIIGELALDENTTFDELSHLGLGVGLDPDNRTDESTQKPGIQHGTPDEGSDCERKITVTAQQHSKLQGTSSTSGHSVCTPLTIDVKQLIMDTPTITVNQTLLNSLPKSKYRVEDPSAVNSTTAKPGTTNYESDTTQPYSSSDETINYWTQHQAVHDEKEHSDEIETSKEPKGTKNPKCEAKTIKFHMQIHGLRHC